MRPTRIALALAFCWSASGAAVACGGSKFTSGSGDASTTEDAQSDVPGDQTTGADAPEDAAPDGAAVDAEARDSGGHAMDARADAITVPDASTSDAGGCGSGATCVAAAPEGWSGPVELFTGSNPPAGCLAPYGTPVFEGGLGPIAAPAACACGCDVDASTMGCGGAPVTYYNGGTGCTGAVCYTDSIGQACQKSNPGPCTGSAEAIIGRPGTYGGSCDAWVDAGVPAWSWTLGALGCSATTLADAGGCTAGTVCAPTPSAPLCIYSDGGSAGCPDAGPYSVSYVLYGGADDTRGCAGCSCEPTGTCTGTLINYNSDIACSGATQNLPIPSGCVSPYSSLGGTYWSGSIGVQNPTCKTDGGAATGAVTQKNPTTFCCTH